MQKNKITIQDVIEHFTQMAVLDKKAVSSLLSFRAWGGQYLADHPTFQIESWKVGDYRLGILGFLNGLFGKDPLHRYGVFKAEYNIVGDSTPKVFRPDGEWTDFETELEVKDEIDQQYVLDFIKAFIKGDAEAANTLFSTPVQCNEKLGESDLVLTTKIGGKYYVTLIGLLNGFFGPDAQNYGAFGFSVGKDQKITDVVFVRDTPTNTTNALEQAPA